MRIRKAGAVCLLAALLLSGCAGSGAPSPEPAGEDALSVAARFQEENGDALQGSAAQFSAGETLESCPLDDSGMIRVSGLPRSGELLLTLLDQRREVQGSMTLSLDQGAVIDATTGADGVGHVTLRRDTNEVALLFVLAEDGSLRCALWLAED